MFKGLKIPKLIRWIFWTGIIFLFLMSLLRLVFYFSFSHSGKRLGSLGRTFLLGFRFDLKMVCFLLEAMLIIGSLNRMDPFHSSIGRKAEFILLGIASLFFTFFYIVDFAHYSYLIPAAQRQRAELSAGCRHFPEYGLANYPVSAFSWHCWLAVCSCTGS